jgi:AGZA family xanthine/uracil permease-like MFS transporter
MRLFVRGDIDGFFGLALDNFIQLLLIVALCYGPNSVLQFDDDLVFARILPAAAISLVVGNLFYAWQAMRLARREDRQDVCALPYGINTVSLFAHVFLVMLPVKLAALKSGADPAAASRLAWQVGLLACLGSGVIEFFGSLVADRLRRMTPRAALLSTLAGIALGFIAMGFVFRTFAHPVVGLTSLAIVLLVYYGGVRFNGGLSGALLAVGVVTWLLIATGAARHLEQIALIDPVSQRNVLIGLGVALVVVMAAGAHGLPGGLIAVAVGTILAWLTGLTQLLHNGQPAPTFALKTYPPLPVLGDLWEILKARTDNNIPSINLPVLGPIWDWVKGSYFITFASVIVPMGLFNLIGSLQNIESAEVAGDSYPVMPSLIVNGLGSVVAAAFGSTFPTTIYIGHPGWKAMGARAGYSTLNCLFFVAVCVLGLLQPVSYYVPIDAGMAIVLWIGIVITAQAFQAVPAKHAPAVVLGLLPGIAAWGAILIKGALRAGGVPFDRDKLTQAFLRADTWIDGVFSLEQGFIFTSIILAAVTAHLIERHFLRASLWCLLGAALSWTGLMHAYAWESADVVAQLTGTWSPFVTAYLCMAAVFAVAPALTHVGQEHSTE